MPHVIAVELDDVLNHFSEQLHQQGILYDPHLHSVTDPLLIRCLYNLQTGLLTRPARVAMGDAAPCTDAVDFLRELSAEGWEIAVLTARDLRLAYDITHKWLLEHSIPCDYLVQTASPGVFCRKAGIPYLIACRPLTEREGVTLFYRAAAAEHRTGAHGFTHFEEVRKCLPN